VERGVVTEQRAPVLTPEHLVRLESALRAQGAPVLKRLRPGASPERLAEPLSNGVVLGAEARLWWGWHDGASRTELVWDRSIGPHYAFISLDDALQEYATLRRITADLVQGSDHDADRLWNPRWLPFTADPVGPGGIACDCSDPSAPSPILRINWTNWREPVTQAAPSLGAVIELWARALEVGAWRYDRQRRAWLQDLERLGPQADWPALIR